MTTKPIAGAFLTILGLTGITSVAVLAVNGCETGPAYSDFPCDPDGGPRKDNPWSCDEHEAARA